MTYPQGLIHFPGLASIQSAKFRLTPGITPSVCTVRLVLQRPLQSEVGTLQFTFGSTRFAFSQCAIHKSAARFDDDGATIQIEILDRRWKWRFGEINGHYNVRRADNSIVEPTRKSARQLAELCLRAMNEPRVLVAALPDNVFPKVHWKSSPPARALQDLCDAFHCQVVLGIDDQVQIVAQGVGRELPVGGSQIFASEGVTAALRPGSIKLVGGETWCQTRLPLRAVGLDADGSIRPINDLSYTPSHGWSQEYESHFGNLGDPDNPAESAISRRNRALALQTVFRWYALAGDAAGGVSVPGFGWLPTPDAILPLNNFRLEIGEDTFGAPRELPPLVEGVFYPLGEDLGVTTENTLYTDDYEIDCETGIVKFTNPVIKLSASGDTQPAELYVTTSFPIRNTQTGEYHREFIEERVAGSGESTNALVITRDDICRRIIESRNVNGNVVLRDNLHDFQREAKAQAAKRKVEFESQPSREIRYAGLVPLQPDGRTKEVIWSVDKDVGAQTIVRR